MAKGAEELFRACYPEVYRYLYSLCRDASLAEDLTAEVFLEVVRSLGGFREESDVKTWLFSIARHRWFRYLRKQKRTVETELLTDFLEGGGKAPEHQLLARELLNRVLALLEQEPERTQSIVRLRLEGRSFYEIGLRHGISENSARVLAFRARERLRQRLQKEGLLDE